MIGSHIPLILEMKDYPQGTAVHPGQALAHSVRTPTLLRNTCTRGDTSAAVAVETALERARVKGRVGLCAGCPRKETDCVF